MLPFFGERFGNPSSRTHDHGLSAAAAVDTARAQVAALVGARPAEVVFTSGATEANNLALKGACARLPAGAHLLTCVTEHHAVLDVVDSLEAGGVRVTRLPVDAQGVVDLEALDDALDAAISAGPVLLSIMAANNETGVLQPLDEIDRRLRGHDVIWHCDAAQAAGKIPLNLGDLPELDLLSLSAHKISGPKGQGALVVRRRRPPLRLAPQIEGGGQERGVRAGTLNVPGIVGFGAAARLQGQEGPADGRRLGAMRDRLQRCLVRELGQVVVNGGEAPRLPHALNLSFGGLHGGDLLPRLRGLSLSSGSACTSSSTTPSHVLTAMGRDAATAAASLRFGLGRPTTEDDIDRAASLVVEVVGALRA
jgi:cysteine desulfurase